MKEGFKTDRLVIRPLEESDESSIYELNTGSVKKYFIDFSTITEVESWAQKAKEKHFRREKEEYVLLREGVCIGMVSPKYEDGQTVSLGIWIGEKFQQQGYAREALNGLIKYLQSRGVRHFIYAADYDNTASIRCIQNIGFTEIKGNNNGEKSFELYV